MAADRLEFHIKERTPIGVRYRTVGDGYVVQPSGHLRRSIKKSKKGFWKSDTYTWYVSTNVLYARWVEYGTSPHVIKPKYLDGELAFPMKSKAGITIAAWVRHPGTRGVFMFRTGTLIAERGLSRYGEHVLDVWARDHRAEITSLRQLYKV